MGLTPGTRLGPYEILAPLGAGGMGEVYRAKDTRLGREVAVKVLPEHLSANPEVRARFEREAKTVSSLNHPNICTLFDVGREGDIDYLVMELVDGETLAQRLARGALPTADLLRLGGQIADALDRAHRAGVVHRDLKPGNVMLTKGGAKLLDFGLARATGLAGSAAGSGLTQAALTQSPTVAQPLTAEGSLVGTFQYMSPEQLEGKEADARSDLWALGCVLFEMATGRRAFEGRSQASLIGAIMNATPAPVSQVAPLTPPVIDRVVAACLAKDPADRIQSAHDVRLQLEWAAEGAASVSEVTAPPLPTVRGRRHWPILLLVGAAASAVTALVLALLPRPEVAAPARPERYTIAAVDLQSQSTPMIAPDGASIIFSARVGGSRRIFRRALDSFDVTPIDGTEDGTAPFFSPDGAWLGFVTNDAIRKVPIGGGVPQTILAEPRVDGADWGRDGVIYFTPRSGGSDGLTALARVPETGGEMTVVARLDSTKGENETWLPEILPDGKTVLVTLLSRGGWSIEVVRPDGSRRTVVKNAGIARYARPGCLVYFEFSSEAVLAAPFDPVKAELTGPAVPLTERVDQSFCFGVNDDGRLVYVPLPGAGEGDEIVWLDRKGASSPAMEARGPWMHPRISPDGRRILLRKVGSTCELWMLNLDGRGLARVTQSGDNHNAIWAPDGRRIAYLQAESPARMMTTTLEGAREVTTLAQGIDPGTPQSWSAGGNRLVYTKNERTTRSDIWIRDMSGPGPGAPFLATDFNETDPSISPDGRWIAYVSNESGAPDVYVRPCPGTGTTWQVSTGGGASPLWSRDGRELYFVSGSRMMAVSVTTTPSFQLGTPGVLFDGGFNTSRPRDFDVDADGRFIAVRRSGGAGGTLELRLLVNWPQALKRTVGTAH